MVVISPEQKLQNAEEQSNEVELLISMFDSNITTSDNNSLVTITITSKYFILILRCLYHEHYPSHQPPIFTIIDMTSSEASHVVDIALLEMQCNKIFDAGECVVYQWVGYITEYLESLDVFVDENSSEEVIAVSSTTENDEIIAGLENLQIFEGQFNLEELQSPFSDVSDIPPPAILSKIYTGDILTERKSHFQAHVCPVTCQKDIDDALAALLLNPKIAAASHNIMAYRYIKESGMSSEDYDDDGENKAGGRLLELIQLMDVENLLVVVSRWYGGVQLGPARFKCINNIAKNTIMESGLYDNDVKKKKKKK